MIVELKEVVTLTEAEKSAIDRVYNVANDILEKVHDSDIYNAAKVIADGIEELGYHVDIE